MTTGGQPERRSEDLIATRIRALEEGQAKLERKLDEDIDPKLTKVVELLEGKPITSSITGAVTGHEPGLVDLVEAINGAKPIRLTREWTAPQQATIGLFMLVLAGILFALLT